MRHDLTDLSLTAGATLTATAVLIATDIAPINDVIRTAIQITSGLPLVLLLPGYAVSTLLLPVVRTRPAHMTSLMWQGMWSVSLSLVVAVTGGLLLNLTRAGLTHLTWTIWLATVTLLALAASATIRRRRVRRHPSHSTAPPARSPKHGIEGQAPRMSLRATRHRALKPAGYTLATVIVIGTAIAVARASASAAHTSHFAQLWLVPAQTSGQASVGVRNDFSGSRDFHLVLRRGAAPSATWNLTLKPGQTWNAEVPIVAGQRLTANLTVPDQHAAPRVVALR